MAGVSEPNEFLGELQKGGAITAIESNVFFDGGCKTVISENQARNGGAIHSIKSNINIHSKVTIVNNTATESGGGIYLYQSQLTCLLQSKVILLNNMANTKGGGMQANTSYIRLKSKKSASSDSRLDVVENRVKMGGGIDLEMIYIHKYTSSNESYAIVNFTANSADYGGAVHVFISDNTNFGVSTEFDIPSLLNALFRC